MIILVVFKVFLVVKNVEILIQIVPDSPIYYYSSSQGLGAILTQQQQNGDYQPIAYGSRALTPTELCYSQTE